MAKTIVVKQIGSPIRRPAIQRQTLIGLGLNKMHKTRELEDTPAVRGMVAKIPHLVRIDPSGADTAALLEQWAGAGVRGTARHTGRERRDGDHHHRQRQPTPHGACPPLCHDRRRPPRRGPGRSQPAGSDRSCRAPGARGGSPAP